jgi:ATP synthase protein I
VVLRAAAATLAVGAVAAVAAGLTAGWPGVAGVAIGTAMVVGFFGLGALALDVVAALMPALSLLVALLTYTLQVVLVGLVFVALTRSGALEESVEERWLGGAVILGTLVWLTLQVLVSTRTRQPVYDLPADFPATDPSGHPGGEAPRGGSGGEEASAR